VGKKKGVERGRERVVEGGRGRREQMDVFVCLVSSLCMLDGEEWEKRRE
jgi:hypothetical protein